MMCAMMDGERTQCVVVSLGKRDDAHTETQGYEMCVRRDKRSLIIQARQEQDYTID